jgi:hypothetical protein
MDNFVGGLYILYIKRPLCFTRKTIRLRKLFPFWLSLGWNWRITMITNTGIEADDFDNVIMIIE